MYRDFHHYFHLYNGNLFLYNDCHHVDYVVTVQWCHMSVMGSQITSHSECLFNSLFGLTLNKHETPASLALCGDGNPLITDGFPSQIKASGTGSISIWWHHHVVFGRNMQLWRRLDRTPVRHPTWRPSPGSWRRLSCMRSSHHRLFTDWHHSRRLDRSSLSGL